MAIPVTDKARHTEQVQTALLADFLTRYPRVLVLTGAGVSTDSGIPDYRDNQGQWKRQHPIMLQAFVNDIAMRKRYWARSFHGWPLLAQSQPGLAHTALGQLQAAGVVDAIVTQNVDGLHQAGGATEVIDLHGRIDRVVCLGCGAKSSRVEMQHRLDAANPGLQEANAVTAAPDGDADVDNPDWNALAVPACRGCGGLLKPDVVFFGEGVPAPRVGAIFEKLAHADAVLVVGSSLMVFSGYRFVRMAARNRQPVAALNYGRTRADALFSLKVTQACGPTLQNLVAHLL